MNIIEIQHLYKKFLLGNKNKTLKERIIYWSSNNREKEFWALRDINLQIRKGESIALIGRNGSGKSTLLKIISKILYPTSGTIAVNGKISSLLELGAGFKPDYTGKENVYLNGSILGMTKAEIDEKYERILEFAEIGDFIDQPVRNYSSGMYMRLAYSIAVISEPEILLIDEILSVGDAKFKEKGLQRILELREKGTTIILVSHSESMSKKVCERAVWLDKGEVILEGNVKGVFKEYNQQ